MTNTQWMMGNSSLPTVIEIIFYPFILLNKELEAISMDRHKTRSTCKIFIAILISTISLYIFYSSQTINQLFIKLLTVFNLPEGSIPIITLILDCITACHIGIYTSNAITRTYCKFFYGDPDFYITKEQAAKLLTQFKEQGIEQITENHIHEVVTFCRLNLRKLKSSDLAANSTDWEQTLECLIYDADLEHFLDQQKALIIKKTQIQAKKNLLENYYINQQNASYNSTSNRSFLSHYGAIEARGLTNESFSLPLTTIPNKANKQRNLLQLEISEKTSLLAGKSEAPIAEILEPLADQKHLKRELTAYQNGCSTQQQIYYHNNQDLRNLQHKEQQLAAGICPERLSSILRAEGPAIQESSPPMSPSRFNRQYPIENSISSSSLAGFKNKPKIKI